MMRLDKYLSQMGTGTRQEVKKFIRQGRVAVDGVTAENPEKKIDEESQLVTFDGNEIGYAAYEYYMLNKPAGVVSATEDRHDRTVLDLIESRKRKDLFPVGRLDKDTEGFLLITNDGPLNHFLLAPGRHVEKTYYVRAAGTLFPEAEKRFLEGLDIGDDKPTLPAELKILKQDGTDTELLLTLKEGRFHQVKRMVQAAGAEVTYLKRISFGGLPLDEDLEKGEYRSLTEEEVKFLKAQAGMKEG